MRLFVIIGLLYEKNHETDIKGKEKRYPPPPIHTHTKISCVTHSPGWSFNQASSCPIINSLRRRHQSERERKSLQRGTKVRHICTLLYLFVYPPNAICRFCCVCFRKLTSQHQQKLNGNRHSHHGKMTSRTHQILIVGRRVWRKEDSGIEEKGNSQGCEKESYIKCVQIAESCRCKETQTKYEMNMVRKRYIYKVQKSLARGHNETRPVIFFSGGGVSLTNSIQILDFT